MNDLTRRGFLKTGAAAAGMLAVGGMNALPAWAGREQKSGQVADEATVHFTKNISGDSLKAAYARVKENLTGKIAVKLHTGEPGGPNILSRDMVKALLAEIPGATIVECNVLYPGPRHDTASHRQVIAENGWNFCPVDILDEDGDALLPIPGGKQLHEVAVGKHLLNYDSLLVLTHFKGHPMGGFGGSLKNIAIGCASGKTGKAQIHREGTNQWAGGPRFMERMVEGGKAITNHFGPRIAYINVLNKMSVDCDCMGKKAAAPTAPDIGVLASTDILAVDKASVDLVYALPEAARRDLAERIESRGGLRQLEYMKILGMGNGSYRLVNL